VWGSNPDMIPQAFIEDLLNRVDVVDVVGRYVKLRKSGANFSGLCPFHNEKSPSFTVSPTKQFYHCFGCGAHGTAIGFLMEYSGLPFPEAVTDLAQGLGMIVPDEDRAVAPEVRARVQAQSVELVALLTQAMDFYRQTLRASSHAIDYLKGRGLTGQVAARFGLGYAPSGWQSLAAIFPEYHAPQLLEAGLVIDREVEQAANPGTDVPVPVTQRRYDRFRDRIMFPIRNPKGQVIGFGGRVLIDDPDKRDPKYLNSPETPVFQKGHELYGLFEGRREIRDAGCVLVVEGYMDVVALAQLGVPNAVATLGTACTPVHVQKLLRHTDRVIFSFDGDAAGRKAARRALEAVLPYAADNKSFAFLFLPAEHDPDSFIRENGREGFEEQMRTALPLSTFLLRELTAPHDLGAAEGRARAQFDAAPLLRAMVPGALRMQILREFARLTESSVDELASLMELTDTVVATRRSQPPARIARRAPAPLEVRAMRILMHHPRLLAQLDATHVQALESMGSLPVDELLRVCRAAGERSGFAAVSQILAQGPEGEFFAALVRGSLDVATEDETGVLDELRAAVAALRNRQIREELAALAAGGLSEPQQLDRYRALTAERLKLKNPE